MKGLKLHFRYSKSQRKGVLFLILLIVIIQVLLLFIPDYSKETTGIKSEEVISFQKQIDSLKQIEKERQKPKIYPFNPNYITDFKGSSIGMSVKEIDRLHSFRKQNKWINSVEQFQKVTKVSDSLLNKISPYFKFPDWVKKKKKKKSITVINPDKNEKKKSRKEISTNDINKATAKDFKMINGIGEKLSERIVNYRKRLQGFSYKNQLYEVWGVSKEVADRALKVFELKEKPIIQKTNVNEATFKEVLRNPYINYELCKKIFNYRDEVAEIQDITELKNIKGFPVEKYERIILYLEAK